MRDSDENVVGASLASLRVRFGGWSGSPERGEKLKRESHGPVRSVDQERNPEVEPRSNDKRDQTDEHVGADPWAENPGEPATHLTIHSSRRF